MSGNVKTKTIAKRAHERREGAAWRGRIYYNAAIATAVLAAGAAVAWLVVSGAAGTSSGGDVLSAGVYPIACAPAASSLSASDRARYHACGELGVRLCGRVIVDDFLSATEIHALRSIADTGMSVTSGGSGGPTVLDLVSGAVSRGDQFISVYKSMSAAGVQFNRTQLQTYRDVMDRVRTTIAAYAPQLTLNSATLTAAAPAARVELESSLVLTKPSFFTRITNKPAVTTHDEYWHDHIDRVQYRTFAATALLYLNDYGTDYSGGRFMFRNAAGAADSVVEPRTGRLSFFTSGHENVHFVEKVSGGTRYALTIAFSCSKEDNALPTLDAHFDAIQQQQTE